ncbi:MAG: response regulator [bacterium]|nr:response regulator [Candidatus Margulisiibacteriota bacterium]
MNKKKPKILVVDDEPDVVSLLETMFKSHDCDVIVARNGQTALEMARKNKPSLILLDVMLPKIDGYRVARMLKFDENFRHIPLIFLTAKIQERDKKIGKEMGADAYITKPFELDVLWQEVQKLLGAE